MLPKCIVSEHFFKLLLWSALKGLQKNKVVTNVFSCHLLGKLSSVQCSEDRTERTQCEQEHQDLKI